MFKKLMYYYVKEKKDGDKRVFLDLSAAIRSNIATKILKDEGIS